MDALRTVPRNVGREDRLIRAAVALSLGLIGGFAWAASGRVSFGGVVFFVLSAYTALTAMSGRDPAYERLGIDTQPAQPPTAPVGDDCDRSTAAPDSNDAQPSDLAASAS